MRPVAPIVILTGAGISAESGLGTFRDAGGIWERTPLEEVATPQAFARDPARVNRFYDARRRAAAAAAPNAAHRALARLEAEHRGPVTVITQNVDDLHERAGSGTVWHMHGRLDGAVCAGCVHRWPAPEELAKTAACPACGAATGRPDVVWFGEYPYHMEAIAAALGAAELFVAIGTSGNVQPAAGFVEEAAAAGADTLELTLEPSAGSARFGRARHGPATEIVPAWVAEVLG